MKRREAITYMSSFVVAYGTRDGMKSYEYSDVSVSQVCPFFQIQTHLPKVFILRVQISSRVYT